MPDPAARRLIVSLTSFPARITFVPRVIDCLTAQTHPADEIVLYLSEGQFPARDADLPEALRERASAGHLRIRWVSGDLKPHKKYIYAFREYPEDIIVTVDDDVLYDPGLLEHLWETHLQYPGAVVAGRTPLITLDSAGNPRPYASWLRRVTGFEEGPSMQLCAVGIGGVLYDPKWFPEELYDESVIRDTCLMADDLWLKAMEAAAGIPVVRHSGSELLQVIPGSQETALYFTNLQQNRNDEILAAIRRWTETRYGRDILAEQLGNSRWPRIAGEDALLDFVNNDKRRTLSSDNNTLVKLRGNLNSRESRIRKLENQILNQENKIRKLENDISLIRASSSYKLGNALLSPLKYLRRKNRIRNKPD